MIKYIFYFLLFFAANSIFGQLPSTERTQVVSVVDSFIASLNRGDSSTLKKYVYKDVVFKSIENNKISTTPLSTFIFAIAFKPRYNAWNEKIWNYNVQIDGQFASVWTEYSFFLDSSLSHCGVNHFLLFKEQTEWKITQITDTRRKDNCFKISPNILFKNEIDTVLNHWHQAAAKAEENIFFDSIMTVDAIYLGTDISERWLRDELKSWAKKVFDKDSAWDFKPYNRNLYFHPNSNEIVWFEESLKTWMGDCRGSGILVYDNGKWKIKHYNLAVSVPNDAMDKYLEIIVKKKK